MRRKGRRVGAMLMTPARRRPVPGQVRQRGYTPPERSHTVWLRQLLHSVNRGTLTARQLDIFRPDDAAQPDDLKLFWAGDLDLLSRPCVSIVGTREATQEGRARANQLAHELVRRGVVIVSGLARGIDAAAQLSALESGGKTIAVIGTPLSQATPVENAALQEQIWKKHLLISPFQEGRPVLRSNFPQRNRVMAALSDATAIIEASDTSGTLHQAAECHRLERWLFIAKAVADDPSLSWPKKFLNYPKVAPLSSAEDILSRLGL
jgi:DNA protecting protein DprA